MDRSAMDFLRVAGFLRARRCGLNPHRIADLYCICAFPLSTTTVHVFESVPSPADGNEQFLPHSREGDGLMPAPPALAPGADRFTAKTAGTLLGHPKPFQDSKMLNVFPMIFASKLDAIVSMKHGYFGIAYLAKSYGGYSDHFPCYLCPPS